MLSCSLTLKGQLGGFCVDSRLLQPKDLFFALPGNSIDGHCFLEEASAKGAVGAVVAKNYAGPSYGLSLMYVPDVLLALQALARTAVSRSSTTVVAITGSVGKTTTKDFVAALLKKKFSVAQTPGNYNSQIGLPLAILNCSTGREDVLVLEMSLSEKGQIAKLVSIAPPDIAILTGTALVHAQYFNSLEDIGMAKAEIFSNPKTRLGILDHSIVNCKEIISSSPCPKVSFSTAIREADYYLSEQPNGLELFSQKSSLASLPLLRLPGSHNKHNFLAAVIVAQSLGMSWEDVEDAMQDLRLPEKRFQLEEKKGVLFIDDSYNASEVSVKAALESMPAPKSGGRKIAVLGEMLELGKFSEGCHRAVAQCALRCVDALIGYGDQCEPFQEVWKNENKPFFLTNKSDELYQQIKQWARPGDVVLLKGSRVKNMRKVLDEF